jgi:hypothetical protein
MRAHEMKCFCFFCGSLSWRLIFCGVDKPPEFGSRCVDNNNLIEHLLVLLHCTCGYEIRSYSVRTTYMVQSTGDMSDIGMLLTGT